MRGDFVRVTAACACDGERRAREQTTALSPGADPCLEAGAAVAAALSGVFPRPECVLAEAVVASIDLGGPVGGPGADEVDDAAGLLRDAAAHYLAAWRRHDDALARLLGPDGDEQ